MPSIAVIIPCFNEAARLQQEAFLQWVKNTEDVFLLFVNDGSTDETLSILKVLQQKAGNKIDIIHLEKNKGKGEAVRIGLQAAVAKSFTYIGYLDADLSTSTKEFYRLYQTAMEQKADIVFASRIKKLGSSIKRSAFRHLAGRVIATIIDASFNLGCYDTQCGAKVFTAVIMQKEIELPFYTKWFFDVELFLRIKKNTHNYSALEIPLTEWHTTKASKINVFSFPLVFKELIILLRNY
ncbi:MAG TPA: glycosyltransferase [Chitinophagaceae bacterium]|nr:glycosyltransferase [Chitinophagaceae bacterium]